MQNAPNSIQLEIPLFPPDMMEKIKAAHILIEKEKEIEKLKKDLTHERHVKAGHIGAYKKLKHKEHGKSTDTTGDY